jgi:hypothetical protein
MLIFIYYQYIDVKKKNNAIPGPGLLTVTATDWPMAAAPKPGDFFGPGNQCRGLGLLPPWLNMLVTEIFSKIYRGRGTSRPPGKGPAQKFYKQNMAGWLRPSGSDLRISQAPLLPFPLDVSFAGRGGSVSGPVRRRFIFPGDGLGALLRLLVPPPGGFGQEQGDDTRADFSLFAVSGVSTTRPRSSDLGPESETETPRDSPPPQSM